MNTQETANPEILKIVDLLFTKYSTILLSKKQTAFITNRSISSLDRDRKEGIGIKYIKETETSNVYYSIYDIAEYIVESKIKIFQGGYYDK